MFCRVVTIGLIVAVGTLMFGVALADDSYVPRTGNFQDDPEMGTITHPDGRVETEYVSGIKKIVYPQDYPDMGRRGAIEIVYPADYSDDIGDSTYAGVTIVYYPLSDTDFPGQALFYYPDGSLVQQDIDWLNLTLIPNVDSPYSLQQLDSYDNAYTTTYDPSAVPWDILNHLGYQRADLTQPLPRDIYPVGGCTAQVKIRVFDWNGNDFLGGGTNHLLLRGPTPEEEEEYCNNPDLYNAIPSYDDYAKQSASPVVLRFDSTVEAAALSPDKTLIAAGTADGDVSLWDATTGELVHQLAGHAANAWQIAFSPAGGLLASAGHSEAAPPPPGAPNQIGLWDVATGAQIGLLQDFDSVWSMAFSPDGSQLLVGTGLSSFQVYDLAAQTMLTEIVQSPSVTNDSINSMVFSPDGSQVAVASFESTKIYSTSTWDVVLTLVEEPAQHLTYSHDGSVLFWGNGGVRAYDPTNGELLHTLFELGSPPEAPFILDMHLSNDSTRLMVVLGTLNDEWMVAETDIVFFGAFDPPIE